MITYMMAIGKGFPDVQCHAVGDGSVYSSIVWDAGSPLPDQTTLDQWIAANPNAFVVESKITVLALRNRFTQTEKVTIEMASMDNPAAPMQQRQLAASLRVFMTDLANATFVDLQRLDTIAGVTTLETYGLIGPGRASDILTSPILDSEKPMAFQ
jgi:hypothetical protein